MKRHSFWDDHKPDTLFVLSKRPSFDGNGTDMTEYAWFVWQNDTNHIEQGIHHIKPKYRFNPTKQSQSVFADWFFYLVIYLYQREIVSLFGVLVIDEGFAHIT